MAVPVDDYIAKLVLLEKAVGHKVQYKVLEPFPLASGSADVYVKIQLAARTIADFVGLRGLTFLVEPVPLGSGTCGRIELSSGSSEVYVQLSPDLFGFPEAILATLSHEVSHKFLHLNGLSWGNGLVNHYHNEVLTDITAVFLGLGKLMLNGRHVEKVIENRSGRAIHSREVGYLTGDQLAFVYALICHMRRISRSELMGGLNSFCVYTVSQTLSTFRRYLRPNLHKPEIVQSIRVNSSVRVAQARERIIAFDREAQRLRELTEIVTAGEVLARLSAITAEVKALEESVDPCLRFLCALRLEQLAKTALPDIERARLDVRAAISDIERAKRHLDDMKERPTRPFAWLKNLLQSR